MIWIENGGLNRALVADRSKAWTDMRLSTDRWTDTNSASRKSSTGSVSTSNPLFNMCFVHSFPSFVLVFLRHDMAVVLSSSVEEAGTVKKCAIY